MKNKIIDAQYWQKICSNGKEAKKALVALVTPDGPVKCVQLSNGKSVPVEDVTEAQALEFMKALRPKWSFN